MSNRRHTLLRPGTVWSAGDVPTPHPAAQLDEAAAVVHGPGGAVPIGELGVRLWPLLDGTRSAPSLARALAEQNGDATLDTAMAVHGVLQDLVEARAVRWV